MYKKSRSYQLLYWRNIYKTKGKRRYLQVYGVYKMNMAKFLLRGKNLNFYLYNFELQFKSIKSKKKKNVYLFKCKLYS